MGKVTKMLKAAGFIVDEPLSYWCNPNGSKVYSSIKSPKNCLWPLLVFHRGSDRRQFFPMRQIVETRFHNLFTVPTFSPDVLKKVNGSPWRPGVQKPTRLLRELLRV
jgi:hypothetical protein